jgi:hypothetical protein
MESGDRHVRTLVVNLQVLQLQNFFTVWVTAISCSWHTKWHWFILLESSLVWGNVDKRGSWKLLIDNEGNASNRTLSSRFCVAKHAVYGQCSNTNYMSGANCVGSHLNLWERYRLCERVTWNLWQSSQYPRMWHRAVWYTSCNVQSIMPPPVLGQMLRSAGFSRTPYARAELRVIRSEKMLTLILNTVRALDFINDRQLEECTHYFGRGSLLTSGQLGNSKTLTWH